jgi:hypothetical protein
MDKLTITLPTKQWQGIRTKYPVDSVFVGTDNFISGSSNFHTSQKGVIQKLQGGIQYNTTPFANPARDQYEATFDSGTRHLLIVENGSLKYSPGSHDFTEVTNGYSTTSNFEFTSSQNRIYFGNGVNDNQTYDLTTSYGGVTYSVPKTKQMGALPPVTAPTPAVPSAGGSVPDGPHTYKVTFLYYGSEESNGGPTSTSRTCGSGNNTIALSAIPIGGYGVTARKIYRDDGDGNWLLVKVLSDNTTTTYSDTASIGTTIIPSTNGLPPKFSKLVTFLSRIFGAGVPDSPSILYFSNPGLPDIFNSLTGFVTCNEQDSIEGLAVYNSKLIILNHNSLGFLSGNTTATFSYVPIPGTIGCVDNRTIQIRTIQGVPVLVWLSAKGFYSFNGSSVDYISDDIEDLVNFTIQQSSPIKGKNVQGTSNDFESGTKTDGIDLDTHPGFIQTINPESRFETEEDWELPDASTTNLTTIGVLNRLQVPTRADFVLEDGAFSNVGLSGDQLRLATGSSFSGASNSGSGLYHVDGDLRFLEVSTGFTVPVSGTLNGVQFTFICNATTNNLTARLRADSANSPGTVITESSVFNYGGGAATHTFTINTHLIAGTKYWIGLQNNGGGGLITDIEKSSSTLGGTATWDRNIQHVSSFAVSPFNLQCDYSFTRDVAGNEGTWTSLSWDTGSLSVSTGMSVTVDSVDYPAGTSMNIFVDSSDDNVIWPNTETVANPAAGISILSTLGHQFWRIRIQLRASDNTRTPSISAPILYFNTVGTWISPSINLTTDTTVLDSLDVISVLPDGTSIEVTVATSDDNVAFTLYGPFASAIIKKWMKIQVVITTTSDNVTTPYVTNIELRWTVVSTFTSVIINTGSTPAGWELLQASQSLNGGEITYATRTASTSGGIPSASFDTATNEDFIPSAIYPYIQWKTILTAHGGQVPSIDSVVINWFITLVKGVRACSIFWNKSYWIGLAEFGEDENSVLLEYDEKGQWYVHRAITARTFSFFFNEPYYGDSTVGIVAKFDASPTSLGIPITLDARVVLKLGARFANDMDDKTKILRNVTAIVLGNGSIYRFYYSVDQGTTWRDLIDINTGSSTFAPTNDSQRHIVSLSPATSDTSINISGRTIFLRVVDATAFTSEIHSLKARVMLREQEVNTSDA